MMETLGGSLKHVKRNEPRGGTWVLTLGDKSLITILRSGVLCDGCSAAKRATLT